MGEQTSTHTPVTYDRCTHIEAPFYHGTKSAFEAGAELVPGYGSDFQQGRVSNNIYFTALVETAAWGAELATALAGSGERGHIYVVEPMGPFEDDPNVTNKRFPGNPTQSYRTRHPLRVVAELESWQGHAPEVLKGMLVHLARLVVFGRVDGVDLHRLVADVGDVVPAAGRNDDAPAVGYLLVEGQFVLAGSHLGSTAAAVEPNELVGVRVLL